jgi:hypothetical protein
MPTIIEHKKVVMVMLALAINEKFHYQRFFQTMPCEVAPQAVGRGNGGGKAFSPRPITTRWLGQCEVR